MRHRKRKFTLDRSAASRRALLRNLAASLILYEHVTTTRGKAAAVRPVVERLISVSKVNTLAVRRRLLATLPESRAARKLLEVIGPRYRDRRSGYLRVVRLGRRVGDGAKLARIEFV